jgi:integrase
MTMPKVTLTDAAVQRYKAPPGARVNYFDASLPGFALRVSGPPKAKPGKPQPTAGGKKAWIFYYRHDGAQKMLTFKPGYPALGLADARLKAHEALKVLKGGNDPAVYEKQESEAAKRQEKEKARYAVEAVVDEFIKRHLQAKRRAPRYIAETRRLFDLHVLPRWRGRPLAEITRRDVIELLDEIADGKGVGDADADGKAAKKEKRRAGGPIAANRTRAAISALCNFAIRRSIIEASPAALTERPSAETKRERTLDDREIVLMWRAAESLVYPFSQFFRLALALGQRRDEIAGMTWDELDLSAERWTLAGARTKGGQPHAVPLSPLALRLIAECLRHGRHVLTTGRRRDAAPGAGDAPISGFSKAKAVLDEKIAELAAAAGEEAPPPWTIHDLRRTCRTGLSSLGVLPVVAELVIGHRQQGIAAVYDLHRYDKEKRQALDAWARHLEALLSPPGGNVVPLRREA